MNPNVITTYSGIQIDPFDPTPDQIVLSDIGWALSRIQRFGAHGHGDWSVAQHSILVANIVALRHGARIALSALLHDAAEAYIGDLPSPIKHRLSDYCRMETALQSVIYQALDVEPYWPEHVDVIKEADHLALEFEIRHFMPQMSERKGESISSVIVRDCYTSGFVDVFARLKSHRPNG